MADEFSGPADEDEPPGPGPLADEVRTLLASVQEWAKRAMPEPPSGHGGPECQWCPLCQFASILRGEHPEVSQRMAEAGNALAGAFRAVLDTAVSHAAPPDASDGEPSGPGPSGEPARAPRVMPDRPRPAPRVQRIQLNDET